MKLFAAVLCAALLGAAGPVAAQVGRNDAAAIAQSAAGGRVLSVERADAGGRPAWRVKLVTARGDVRVVMVDATTGRPF